VTRQPCLVGNHELELPKRPSVELRPLFSTTALTAVSDTAEVFQHNETIRGKTIDKATANGMEISSCPTAFLVAQPCPSFFSSRAFALQNASSGTEPLTTLYRLHTRNLDTVRSHYEVNLAEIDTNDTLRWIACFWDWNRNSDMQVEFTVPMTLENSRSGFRISEDWNVALSDLNGTFDPFPVARGKAHPDFIVFPE
jgi:hypothetical protein